jgi:membrane-associated protease RseP (regulator of RpoE activity)
VGFRLFGIDISFSFWFFAVLSVFLVLGREVLAVYMILPIAIHECGHLIAMVVCRVGIEGIAFTAFSVDIKRSGAATGSYGRDIFVCLGGVIANVITAVCFYFFTFQSMRVMFFIAVNIAIAAFNIMPVGNLDGGQILRLVLERFGNPATAYRISRVFSFVILIPIFALAIFLMMRDFANISLLLACIYLACVVVFRD